MHASHSTSRRLLTAAAATVCPGRRDAPRHAAARDPDASLDGATGLRRARPNGGHRMSPRHATPTIATHFRGPTWQATDGSTAVGSLVRGITVDPTAIPWLLLSATGIAGPDGDRLAKTTFIQRVATTGGLVPPAEQCNAGTADTENEIPYTADYYFWKGTGV